MYRVHFIAIGGSAMHNLAIELSSKHDYVVTGSDDVIFDPAYSRLKEHRILPKETGWFPEKIHKQLDAVILGMHAREDNPELLRAQELGLNIYSFPEYLFQRTRSKTRIVIGGSHGKTTTTAMILHVLKKLNMRADYMVGAQIDGFDNMVSLNDNTRIAVFEGDEYLSSSLDLRSKFILYQAHIAVITGIAWDHINVFPSFDLYKDQFRQFVESMDVQGRLIYFSEDNEVKAIAKNNSRTDIVSFPYKTPKYEVRNGVTYVKTAKGEVQLSFFGEHNLQNMEAARMVCRQIGVWDDKFYEAIADFKGASNRMQKIVEKADRVAFKDFAHAPSKLEATVKAARLQYPERKIIACMELHTFSSLTDEFLPQYKDTMKLADKAFVYFNPEVVKHKQLKALNAERVKEAFGTDNVEVFTDTVLFQENLQELKFDNSVLLLMTSGNFNGVNLIEFAKQVLK